ncbi:MAG: Smr/MutS family protein [Anaerolineae bacterium]|nr:Smr/MutS family protein [Anaerolineae bacterium]
MLAKHLNTLELPKILEQLAKECSFSASIELAHALRPSTHPTEVRQWLEETSEARQAMETNDTLGIGGARDVRDMVMRAGRGGMMEPSELLDVRETLHSARNLQRAITRYAELYPRLNDLVVLIEPQVELVESISHCIDDRGEVRDSASPELRKIRVEVRIAHDRLLQKLQNIVNSNGSYLQESLITQRNGRYVIPVKSDFKGRVAGVVHDQSASGLTMFIEPLATLELNNTWRELQLAEQHEIRRILVALSNQVGGQRDSILRTVEQIARFDLVLAKAKYADRLRAKPASLRLKAQNTAPTVQFSIEQARHPLLDPEKVVPIDITLDPSTRILVITGPNTGGKTVAMKTIGLLGMMTQCGLHLPVESAILPIFDAVYADIGDEQSIEQSLSTFSAHLTNLVSFLSKVDANSLVLMDELGSGTDPIEGAALARATLDYLLRSQAICVVATHYAELKAWAAMTEGVANANVAFDVKTLRPLYKLTIGLPGKSNAFAIAQRLGLPQPILDDAQQHLTGEHMKAEDMLSEIEKMRRQTEAARNAARRAERVAEDNADKLRAQLRKIDEERQRVMAQAHDEAEKEIELLRAEVRRLRGRVVAAGEALDEVREIERELNLAEEFAEEEREKSQEPRTKNQEVSAKSQAPREDRPTPSQKNLPSNQSKIQNLKSKIQVGDTVRVKALDSLASITSISDDMAEVQIGRMRMKVKLRDVERAKAPEPVVVDNTSKYERGHVEPSPGMELDMRGMMSEEGVERVQDYLDRASRAGLPFVRIIHGKGTGALRRAVRESIKDHAAVKSFETGLDGEGGDGVTVVKLHALM